MPSTHTGEAKCVRVEFPLEPVTCLTETTCLRGVIISSRAPISRTLRASLRLSALCSQPVSGRQLVARAQDFPSSLKEAKKLDPSTRLPLLTFIAAAKRFYYCQLERWYQSLFKWRGHILFTTHAESNSASFFICLFFARMTPLLLKKIYFPGIR